MTTDTLHLPLSPAARGMPYFWLRHKVKITPMWLIGSYPLLVWLPRSRLSMHSGPKRPPELPALQAVPLGLLASSALTIPTCRHNYRDSSRTREALNNPVQATTRPALVSPFCRPSFLPYQGKVSAPQIFGA